MSKRLLISCSIFFCAVLLFLGVFPSVQAAGLSAKQSQAKADSPSWKTGCTTMPQIPVALTPGGDASYRIASTLCLPQHHTDTIIVTYHGSTYAQYYWAFPYKPETYSFVDAMTGSGFAVLNIDRIGDGLSSHPLSSLITVESDSYTLHQIVQDVRAGSIGDLSFKKVVLATHSLGGYIAWYAGAMYPQDFDGIIETGAIHDNSVTGDNFSATISYPAIQDPKFKNSGLDLGYQTTKPGYRAIVYYHQVPETDPQVAALDEQLKQTRVLDELIEGINLASTHISNMIHVPVLSVLGQFDFFGCAPDAMDCSSAAPIKQAEAPYYAPDACLEVYDLMGAGHDLNLAPNAGEWYNAATKWINGHVENHVAGCGTRPQSVPLHQVSPVFIPGAPASNWCYDAATVDEGKYYLADDDNRAIDVVRDGSTPTLVTPIGKGSFTGPAGCRSYNYDSQGPDGITVAHDQIFASNGDSSVRVYTTSGQFVTTIPTNGHLRADESAYDARDQWVVVANGAERDFGTVIPAPAPFLTFISTKKGSTYDQVVKTLTFPNAAGLEQPLWNPYDGKIYVTVTGDYSATKGVTGTGGEVDVIDPTTWQITSIATPDCGDSGLALASRDIMAVGCGNGDQIVLNLDTHQITRVPLMGVDIIAATSNLLFYPSYGTATQAPQLVVTDLEGRVLQTIPITSASHTVTVDQQTHHVFVPLDGGNVMVLQY